MLLLTIIATCIAFELSLSADHIGIEKVSNKVQYPAKFPPLSIQTTEKLNIKAKLEDFNARQFVLHLGGKESRSFAFKPSGSSLAVSLDSTSVGEAGIYDATIFIANDKESIEYPVGSIEIVSKAVKIPNEFSVKPELSHTFRPDEKPTNPFISNLFTVLVLLPWVFLLSIWYKLGVNIRQFTYSVGTTVSSSFYLISLGVSLLLFHAFWLKLNLFQFFYCAIPMWSLTAFFGRLALVQRAANQK